MRKAKYQLVLSRWTALDRLKSLAQGAFQGLGTMMVFIKAGDSLFHSVTTQLLQSPWAWLCVVPTMGYAAYHAWPSSRYSYKLKNRDVNIDLYVGDIFEVDGASVIPTNTTFDTELDHLKSATTVQGACLEKHYDSVSHLNHDLDGALEKSRAPFEEIDVERPRKRRRYGIGTVASVKAKGRTCYWLAMSHINQHGRAEGSAENIRTALPALWTFVCDQGEKGVIAIPLLGTGAARASLTREDAVKEIVRSFIAANSMKSFCERLVIVIHPKDCKANSIDLERLSRFLQHECEHTELPLAGGRPVGSPVSHQLEVGTSR